jgi:hypothetical protein
MIIMAKTVIIITKEIITTTAALCKSHSIMQ